MKTLCLSIVVFLAVSIILSQTVFAQTAHEILQQRDAMPATRLTHAGAVLIINQTVDKLEYKMGENITIHPQMINIGNSSVFAANGMPLFDIQVVYENGSKFYDSGYSGGDIVGAGFTIKPGMIINDTGSWGPYPGATAPVIKINTPGKYKIFSESNIQVYGDIKQWSTPNYPVESLWSKPIEIIVLPEKYVQNTINSMLSQDVMINETTNNCDKKISNERDAILNSIDRQNAVLLAESDRDFYGLVGNSKYTVGQPSVGGNVDYAQCSILNPNIQIQFNVLSPNTNLGNCPYVIAVEDRSASKVLAIDLGSCSEFSSPSPNPPDVSQTPVVIVIGGIVGGIAVGLSAYIMAKRK